MEVTAPVVEDLVGAANQLGERTCRLCGGTIPWKIKAEGRSRSLQNRKYCLRCSPYKCHNTRQLKVPFHDPLNEKLSLEGHRLKYRRYQKQKRRQRKRAMVALLGGRCEICGYDVDCPRAYDFHHRDPQKKSFALGGRGLLRRWEDLVAELKKCALLCRCCHAEVHDGLHGDSYGRVAQPGRAVD
jgi:hypothetical protein